MSDFDKEWARSRRSFDRTARFIMAFQMAVLALAVAAVLCVAVLAIRVATNAESVAAQTGRAVAAFERARSGQ